MPTEPSDLPHDVDSLRALIVAERAERQAARHTPLATDLEASEFLFAEQVAGDVFAAAKMGRGLAYIQWRICAFRFAHE